MKIDVFPLIRVTLGGALCVLLWAACESPIDVSQVDSPAQLAKEGKGNGNGGGGGKKDPPLEGVWGNSQVIVYNESFSGGDRLVVVDDNGSNRAVVFTSLDGEPRLGEAEIAPDGMSIVFHYDAGVYKISRDDDSVISEAVNVFDFGLTHYGPQQTVSPDGTKIAWIGIDPAFMACNLVNSFDLYVYDGEKSTRITSNNVCGSDATISTKSPAWVSNTEIAVSQWATGSNVGSGYIEAWNIGTLEDEAGDFTVTKNTQSTLLPVALEWAPDLAQRGVIWTPWNIYLLDFPVSTGVSTGALCNITSHIAEAVRDPSLGPDGRIVFRIRTGDGWSLASGTVGSNCDTSVVINHQFATGGKQKKNRTTPSNPHWRRPMP